MPVTGIEAVRRGFRVKVESVTGRDTERAVYNVLQAGASYSDMMTPIDTSNLINSRYAPQITQSNGKTSGSVGYTAAYAAAVHGMSGKLKGKSREDGRGEYWDPDAEPGFLEKGFEQAKPEIPAILKASYE